MTKPAAPAVETAPDAFLSTLADAEVPQQTRVSRASNPMLPICATLAESHKAGNKVAKTVTAPDKATVTKIKRWLSLAGQANGVTFRSTVADLTVTFWAVDRIVHSDAKANETAETPAV